MTPAAAFQLGGSPIAAGSSVDFTISATVEPGELVKVAPLAPLDATWEGVIWVEWVSAPGKISVRLANVTAAEVTPDVQDFSLKAL